ncbi:DUF7541 family protein [Halorientalis marina]|uniref:DUF7541 family protein n=1 Tax=Halorientalis marina TaxID=2931976 RepID=UPI001FF6E0EB|nr:cox cluster protein [Halorientalis marina]
MEEDPGLSDQYRMASPWPVFVALGLAISEVGIVVGIFSVAVGGLLLFGGSVAGILKESGYVAQLWGSLLAFGVVLVAIGGGLFVSQVDPGTIAVLDVIAEPAGYGAVVPRALAIGVSGVILLAAGGTGRVLEGNVEA